MFDRIDGTRMPSVDPDADALIRERIARNPAAPYAMAQTIAIQNQLLEKADARIRALESGAGERAGDAFEDEDRRPAGGMAREADAALAAAGPRRTSVPVAGARPSPWGGGGGSFLAGAGQVALGVAGGALLASAIQGLFADEAAAAPAETPPEEAPADEHEADGYDDDGGDFGGDFGD